MEETEVPDMANSTSNHSTESANGKWDTKRVAVSAMFVALAIATSFIEIAIFPAAPFLKFDPSGIFVLLAALLYGMGTGCVVATLPWVFRLFTNPAGALMSFMMGITGVIVACLIYKRKSDTAGLVIALVCATIASVLMACIANLVVTPLYTGVDVATVAAMIVPIIIPFNIMKFTIDAVVAGLVFVPLKKIL